MGLLNSLGKLGHCIMDTNRFMRIVTLPYYGPGFALQQRLIAIPAYKAMLEQQVEQERSY